MALADDVIDTLKHFSYQGFIWFFFWYCFFEDSRDNDNITVCIHCVIYSHRISILTVQTFEAYLSELLIQKRPSTSSKVNSYDSIWFYHYRCTFRYLYFAIQCLPRTFTLKEWGGNLWFYTVWSSQSKLAYFFVLNSMIVDQYLCWEISWVKVNNAKGTN